MIPGKKQERRGRGAKVMVKTRGVNLAADRAPNQRHSLTLRRECASVNSRVFRDSFAPHL